MVLTQNFVIIVAAGKGVRMGAGVKKQYLLLDQVPVLARTLMAFDRCDVISEIILVVPKEDLSYCREKIIAPFAYSKPIHLVGGGKQRQDSVLNGLKEIVDKKASTNESIVLIHDGVRPFVAQDMIENCIQTAQKHGACLPAIKITDTIKRIEKEFQVKETVQRQMLYCAQTPQAFRLSVIHKAFEYAKKTHFTGTDDASLVEHSGHSVMICEGSKFNIKLTTPDDLVLGEFILSRNI